MFSFLTPKISGFGIDLSDLSIKIVNLKKQRGKIKIASLGRQEIPIGLIEKGEIKKEPELIEIIKQGLTKIQGEALKTKYCIVSLPETESFIRIIKMPLMKQEEVGEAIKWELEANIPMSIDEIYYDWQIIEEPGGAEKQLNILIGALPKKTVDPYLDVLHKAGLRPFVFEIESIATARALIKNSYSEKPILILDIGAKRTNIFIFSNHAIYFTSSLPVCNASLVKTLSEKLAVSEAKALEIKLKVGLDLKHPKGKIFGALAPDLREMTEKIKVFISFYQEHFLNPAGEASQLKDIRLCGGGANLTGLTDFLSSELSLNVTLGNPLINLSNNKNEAPVGLKINDPLAYTTALGLALRNRGLNQ